MHLAPSCTTVCPWKFAWARCINRYSKVCRNLHKRLAKIEAAKAKKSKGAELTAEQEESVASEASLRDELRSLGATNV